MKHMSKITILLICLLLFAAAALADDFPESSHPYANYSDITWTYEHSEEAYALKIIFSDDTEFENSYDFLYITGEDGVTHSYTGNSLSGAGVYVIGDSVTFQLTSDGSYTDYGFTITAIEAVTQTEYEEYIKTPKFSVDSDGTITACDGQMTELVIPSEINGKTITGIGNYVFQNNTAITSVVIPETVINIGCWAFSGCTNLTEIELPDGLQTIDDYAFYGCKTLTEIELPASVTKLGSGIIDYSGVKRVTIMGEDVEFSQDTFPVFDDSMFAEQSPIVMAKEGSNTYKKLQQYGVLSGVISTGFTLKNALSKDKAKPTHILAVNDGILDLSNKQGYEVVSVLDYYSRADLPRNEGMQKDYLTEYEVNNNKWTYSAQGTHWDTSMLIIKYKDSEGNIRYSDSYYVQYGVADMSEPKIKSPIYEDTHDGVTMLPWQDLEVEWTKVDNCVYEVSLYEYDGGLSMSSDWSIDGLTGTKCVIPKENLLPSETQYYIIVEATNKETGETVDSRCGFYFRIYGSDIVTDIPEIISPFSNVFSRYEEHIPVVPYTGDLKIAWNPVKNAVKYEVYLYANIKKSGRMYVVEERETTGTSITVSADTISRYMNYDDVESFQFWVYAYDRYGNCTGESTAYTFTFRDTDVPVLKVDGKTVSSDRSKWTAFSAGKHTIKWNSVSGADEYRISIVRKNGDDYYVWRTQESYGSSVTSMEFEVDDNNQYIIVFHVVEDGTILNGGYYYINVNADTAEYSAPEIKSPTADFLGLQKVSVSWTDVGASSYTVSLNKKMPDDYNEEYNVFGDKNPYYSSLVSEKTGITGTSCSFPSSALEYGAMYRIVVTAHYPGGITKTADHLFKVKGDPAECPNVSGVLYTQKATDPANNIVRRTITIKWSDDSDANKYEATLYSINSKGKRVEMEVMKQSTDAKLTISADALSENTAYELNVREYDSDSFSKEYRLYFAISDLENCDTLSLPASLKKVEDDAWSGCTSIEYVCFEGSPTSIGARAFKDCTRLICIDIPASVTYIGDDAFAGCDSVVVYCVEGSYTHDWCKKNNVDYELK